MNRAIDDHSRTHLPLAGLSRLIPQQEEFIDPAGLRDCSPAAVIAVTDLDTSIDGKPRMMDLTLAAALGFSRVSNIRLIISRHLVALSRLGEVCFMVKQTLKNNKNSGGRPGKAYYLNKKQALYICTKSETENATEVTIQMVEVFDAFMADQLVAVGSPIPVRAHDRRTSTRVDDAIKLKTNIDRLETVVTSIQPAQPNFCAMVVDGQSVFVDVNAYALDDEPAVVMTNDGQIKIMNASISTSKFKPAGVRSGHGPWRPSGHGGRVQEGVVILGKVMKGAAQPTELPPPSAVPALPAPKPRGRPKIYRDEIVKLICDGLDNWAIVAKTGASYWTVAHWRRWMTSGPIAD